MILSSLNRSYGPLVPELSLSLNNFNEKLKSVPLKSVGNSVFIKFALVISGSYPTMSLIWSGIYLLIILIGFLLKKCECNLSRYTFLLNDKLLLISFAFS